MDSNKDKVLTELDYKINKCCGLCIYGEFPNNDWGTCKINVYEHLKHETVRNLSINKFGICPKFSASKDLVAKLGLFSKFIKDV